MRKIAVVCLTVCLTLALFATLAFGQIDRVFYLTHTDNPQALMEVNNIVRAMANVQAAHDATKKTLSVQGTAEQVALVEWMLAELDRTPASLPGTVPAMHPFRDERGVDQVVRVFSLAYAVSPLSLQELTNTVRSISDMQRVFPYNSLKLLVMRGTAEQMAMAEWLVQQLDVPPGSPPVDTGTRDIHLTDTIVQTARVFYLTHNQSPQDLQIVVNRLRKATKVQRAYPYNAQWAIAVRGSSDQIAAIGRLVRELDR
jgi:type II secretory pathway component GspD/PulD (secretin)